VKGYIHIYTGNGKGKTTAAIGLAVRAAGAGKKIFFCQFLKGKSTSELKSFEKLRGCITVYRCGTTRFITGAPSQQDIRLARKGFAIACEAVRSRRYQMVILDEIIVAVNLNLIPQDELYALMKNKPEMVEIVLTGRNASPQVIKIADLVTRMKDVKHYFLKGVKARRGIEF
jgi:cob(I)alamin adenosyltransferase